MNKAQLLEQVIIQAVSSAERLSESSRAARQASIEAPGAMQSHSDTTKSQQDWLSHALSAASIETRERVQQLKGADISPSSQIRVGSLVALREEGKDIPEVYFILPAGSGIVVSDASQRVVVTAPDSPVGIAILGKVVGDRCEINAPKGVRSVVVESSE